MGPKFKSELAYGGCLGHNSGLTLGIGPACCDLFRLIEDDHGQEQKEEGNRFLGLPRDW